MAVDVKQVVAGDATPLEGAPQPEAQVDEQQAQPATEPSPTAQPEPEAASPTKEQPTVETPTTPAAPNLETRLAQLEKTYQQTQQERDYYKGTYETQRQDAAKEAVKAADTAELQRLQRAVEQSVAGLDKNSDEYRTRYDNSMYEAKLAWREYEAEKRDKEFAAKEDALKGREALAGRSAFYTEASVRHRIPLAKLQQILPNPSGINNVDAVAGAWRLGYDEATRAFSARTRIADGTDNVPVGAGTGGGGYTNLEDAEAAFSDGKINWAQFESMRPELKYRDGTTPSY